MTQQSAITINFSCVKCGSVLETKDDIRTDASIVTCKSCGHEFGTYGELKAQATLLAFPLGLPILIAACVLGGMRPRAAIRRLVPSMSDDFVKGKISRHELQIARGVALDAYSDFEGTYIHESIGPLSGRFREFRRLPLAAAGGLSLGLGPVGEHLIHDGV